MTSTSEVIQRCTPDDQIVTGYKATKLDMTCRDFQFELGVWYECEGDLEPCSNGFHFCEQLTGCFEFYPPDTSRLFCVEAKSVLDPVVVDGDSPTDGAATKRVARWIRLVEEVPMGTCIGGVVVAETTPAEEAEDRLNLGTGNRGCKNVGNNNNGRVNTGNKNIGHANSGDCNRGYQNTGEANRGDCNTGYGNTGSYNSGNQNIGRYNAGAYNDGNRNTGNHNRGDDNAGFDNTGDDNTGASNVGDRNTGSRNRGRYNSGDGNAGHRNSGSENIGDCNTGCHNVGGRNTGIGNQCSYNSGWFNTVTPTAVMFDEDTGLSHEQVEEQYGKLVRRLAARMCHEEAIAVDDYVALPGITQEKLNKLHWGYQQARLKAGK